MKEFCLTKPICREAPGKSISVRNDKKADKYIWLFSVHKINKFFKLKHLEFLYKLTTFRTLVLKTNQFVRCETQHMSTS